MKLLPAFRLLFSTWILLLLASCATPTTPSSTATSLVPDQKPQTNTNSIPLAKPWLQAAMNRNAGRGEHVLLTLSLSSGQEIPFCIDTGSPITCINAAYAPQLGQWLGNAKLWLLGNPQFQSSGVYPSPPLLLGKTPLLTGDKIYAYDFSQIPAKNTVHPAGVLGMDCLKHYVVQLDFTLGKIWLLDPATVAPRKSWGTPIPLKDIGNGCCEIPANLVDTSTTPTEIDTGCDYDGWLSPPLFARWNDSTSPAPPNEARKPNGILAGETYHQLFLHAARPSDLSLIPANGIGLHFLSRHLVTFDFPRHTLYLKRTSEAPLLSDDNKSVIVVIREWVKAGRLPGFPAGFNGEFELNGQDQPDGIQITLQKKGDVSLYHYLLRQSPLKWTLLKAWRVDQSGNILESYQVP